MSLTTDYSLDTDLVIHGVGNVAASARGVRQSISLVENGKVRVTLSGRTEDQTRPANRKFKSTIRGSDLWPPALSGLWRGQEILVDNIVEFTEPAATPQQRTAVPGSMYFIDDQGFEVAAGAAAYRVYRPRLSWRVLNIEIERDEWGEVVTWSIELRET